MVRKRKMNRKERMHSVYRYAIIILGFSMKDVTQTI